MIAVFSPRKTAVQPKGGAASAPARTP